MNILFLLIDCLRADALAGGRAPTPNLDAVAGRGVRFTQAIAGASSTTPCVATMLTGVYSPRHGVRAIGGHRLNPDCPTLPQQLQAAGYHTVAEVTGPLGPENGLDRGFKEYHLRHAREYLSDGWGAGFIDRLRRRAWPEPWFLFLHLWELHTPRKVLPAFKRRRFGRTRYDRALAALDATLAPLLAALPADTAILIHGDHGERLIENNLEYRWYRLCRDILGPARVPKREGHEIDVYEELIRVPLVLAAPGHLPAGAVVPQLVRQVDLMPTLLDLAGAAIPPGLDGVSLLPAVRSGVDLGLECFIEAIGKLRGSPRDRRVGWRTAEWKYIAAPQAPERPEELYRLATDPRERVNLAAAEPERTRQFRERVAAVEARAGAAAPALTAAEQATIEQRLRDLGYLE